MIKILSIISLVLIVLTAGCGFAIHYGGKEFEGAIKGHMALGILSVLSVVILLVAIFLGKK